MSVEKNAMESVAEEGIEISFNQEVSEGVAEGNHENVDKLLNSSKGASVNWEDMDLTDRQDALDLYNSMDEGEEKEALAAHLKAEYGMDLDDEDEFEL